MPEYHKARVPAEMRPNIHVQCPKCFSAMKTKMSTAHYNGQHRRHKCIECGNSLYTLTPFGQSEKFEVSDVPFKDRALTEGEVEEREAWIDAAEGRFDAMRDKVKEGIWLTRLAIALRVDEENRTPQQLFLASSFYDTIEDERAIPKPTSNTKEEDTTDEDDSE